jgi:transposase
MIDRTTLLFALPGFRVMNVTLEPDGGRLVLVESLATEDGCPSCGVMSSRIEDRPVCRLKDLPHGRVPLRLWVCKRRSLCAEKHCARGSFTEISDQVPARSRLTQRLRSKVSAAVTATNRAMSEVAGDYGVAWWTVHCILVATDVEALGQAAPTTMIGIDENFLNDGDEPVDLYGPVDDLDGGAPRGGRTGKFPGPMAT